MTPHMKMLLVVRVDDVVVVVVVVDDENIENKLLSDTIYERPLC
jgi:hypothetical protein